MVLLIFIAAGLMYSFLTGGRLKNFERCTVRQWWLPIASALVELTGRTLNGKWDGIPDYVFVLAQYLLLLAFVAVNIRKDWSLLIFGAGTLMNFAVIAANGFRMPVLMQLFDKLKPEIATSLQNGEIWGYALAKTDSPLLFLGDVFYIPIPFFNGFASIGDFLIGMGAFFLCVLCLKGKKPKPRNRRRLDAEEWE